MLDEALVPAVDVVHDLRDVIVRDWMAAVALIGVAPLRQSRVRAQIRRFADHLLELLSADLFEPALAQPIGEHLAALVSGHPEVLERTSTIFTANLLPSITDDHDRIVAMRLPVLLGHLATGYLRESRAAILREQERSRVGLEMARTRAMAALREHQAQLQLVLNHLPIALVTIDRKGIVHFAAGHAFTLAGQDPLMLIGQSVYAYYSDMPDLVTYIQEANSGQTVTRMFVRHGRTYEVWLMPLEDDAAPLLVMATDITERVRAVAERTELERAMQLSQRRASLGLLAGGVVHDFQNLLAIIHGNASLLRHEYPAGENRQEEIERIVQAASQAAALVRQLLAYSTAAPRPNELVDLNKIIRDMLPLIEVIVPDEVALEAELAPDLDLMEGDPTQIRQVIMNLTLNAAEAIGDRPGRVLITTEMRQVGDRHELMCQVRDTGCGMDEATVERIFDPFFTTKKTGHGLGLSALQSIVRQHHGSVLVHSEAGQGTTFTLLFPVAD